MQKQQTRSLNMSPAQITILLNYIPLEKTASEACTVYVTFNPKDFAIKIQNAST